MASPTQFNEGVYDFIDNVFDETSYEDTDDAEYVFSQIRSSLAPTAKTPDGQKVIRFAAPQAIRASEESGLKDVIKILWRMTKVMPGDAQYKLTLFILGSGTVCSILRASPTAHPQSKNWIVGIEKWLGVQLTIGGQGCTGEGEGSVSNRIQMFMSKPYLHDFD